MWAHGKRTRKGKPWSGHTIGRMLANRLYLGEVGFRDVTAKNAHPGIVDPDLFEQCQQILQARGEARSQRAASNSDYQLTGLITAAITERAIRAEGSDQRAAELGTITGQIATTEGAIDRYLTAFENATRDERTCGHRVRDLTIKLDQLHARRRSEFAELVHSLPSPPSPEAIENLRRRLAHVFEHGTPGQRKV